MIRVCFAGASAVSGGDAKTLERRSGPRQHRPEAIFPLRCS